MEKHFGGGKLYLLAPSSPIQMMGYVYRDADSLIVIDGGMEADYPELKRIILQEKGSVDCLIITHCHLDHIGALTLLLEEREIPIKRILFDFPSFDLIDPILQTEFERDLVRRFLKAAQNSGASLIRPKEGDEFRIGGNRIRFFKDGHLENGDINDSSLVFKLETKGESILFLGDVSPKCGDALARRFRDDPDFRADFIQLAHHGQQGGGKLLYQTLRGRYALWNAPKWLYENDGGGGPGTGPYRSDETKRWLVELGMESIFAFERTAIIE